MDRLGFHARPRGAAGVALTFIFPKIRPPEAPVHPSRQRLTAGIEPGRYPQDTHRRISKLDPLYIFVFIGLFSPGPNVILLTASGARFGFRPTLPHVGGVAFGVGITAGLTGLGIGAVIEARPGLELALKLIAAAWIGWMAVQLWRSSATGKATAEKDRPFTFLEAVLFQWVNPKVWAVALAAASGYGAGLGPWGEAQRLAIAFSGLNLFVCLFWSFAGALLALLLTTPRAWRLFARVMSAGLAASAVMVFL